ncbi:TetR/AcrR family transcriptional regulator [Rhodococcus oryzae]|uniref:TetR/AcrR family transcriptional regulator n=1 Tax=Rhodococcus oryzae TaxID=2571143 RepID=UPI0037AD5389
MATARQSNQRKRPQQARSIATENGLLDAAGQVLAEHGYGGCSTNRIADRAGVSKGSLYQYFADKDEVLTALAERMAAEINQDIGDAIDRGLGDDWQTLGEAVLSATFEALENRGPMLRPLLREAPHIKVMDMISEVVTRAQDVGRTYIALNPDQFRPDLDVEAYLYVLIAALKSVLTDHITQTTSLPRERLATALMTVTARSLTPDSG